MQARTLSAPVIHNLPAEKPGITASTDICDVKRIEGARPQR